MSDYTPRTLDEAIRRLEGLTAVEDASLALLASLDTSSTEEAAQAVSDLRQALAARGYEEVLR